MAPFVKGQMDGGKWGEIDSRDPLRVPILRGYCLTGNYTV
jgi:hypothetical protein